jgi:8-amino-7-oxononanoate synthase
MSFGEADSVDQSGMNGVLAGRLEDFRAAGLERRLHVADGPQGTQVVRDGRELVNFSSNDYLGLAAHPALIEAALIESRRSGFGSGASRLVSGTMRAHAELEVAIAAFKRTPAALAFSSGSAAAAGTVPALCGSGDVVILDKLSHACLVDAARACGADMRVFPHNDCGRLESHLKWAREKRPGANILVIAEAVYSMDGDTCPLEEIVALKERHGAWLLLDEAHATGVIGEGGRGLAHDRGLGERVEIRMGTLGKAVGAHGGFIAGSAVLRDYLIHRARSFVFSTAPPPPLAAAAIKGIELLQSPEGDERRRALWDNLRTMAAVLGVPAPASAILPVVLGSESSAVEASQRLLEGGVLVPAIRYPTVPKGGARLRITLSANHTREEIEKLGTIDFMPRAGMVEDAP